MSICIHVASLTLRSWAMKDMSDLSLIGNDDAVAATMNDGFPRPFTEEKTRAIRVVSAEPFAINHGSRRALEKNGFRLLETVRNGARKGAAGLDSCRYEYISAV